MRLEFDEESISWWEFRNMQAELHGGRERRLSEITPRGFVLPIGSLKEKTLAALRAGIREVIIPKLNEKDLVDVPAEVRQKLKFNLAETVDDVLAVALDRKKATGGRAEKRRVSR